jgi:TldD protein
VQENVDSRITVLNGDIAANAHNVRGGISARAYKNGVWGFASTPELSDTAINHILEQAVTNARFLAEKSGQKKTAALPAALPSGTGSAEKNLATKKTRFDRKELIGFVKTIDDYCIKHYPWLASRMIAISCLDMEKTLFTDEGNASGSRAYSLIPRAHIYVSLTKI